MNTVTLHFKADNQQLTALDGLYKLASNTVEYVKAIFTLGENWTGFDVVRAAWYTDFECISTVLDGNGECFVPWEVLSRPEGVTINLYGCDLEEESDGEAVLIDRLTTYPVKAILVDVDARVCGSETKPVTPSQFEQYIAIVEGIVHSVKDIDHTELNADYTLTIYYTDGTSDTVGPIRGEQGPVGPAGNGIGKIEKVGTAGLVDTYRITYTNGQTYEYTVTNGAKGETGNGIESIYLTGTSGAVKTYTILFTDGNTFEYNVTDGEVTFATLEQLMPKDTASGDIASFPDGQAVFPLKSCVVNIEPVQAGSGTPSPDNVRPITGRTGCEVVNDPTYGGYINWNQLLKSTLDSDTNRGVSFSRNPDTGLFTLSGTSTSSYASLFTSFTAIQDHVYCHLTNIVTNPNNVTMRASALNINWATSDNMKKCTTTQITAVGLVGFSANTNMAGITGYFHILDLTEIFGATKADEILAMETSQKGKGLAYVKSIFPNDYYAYNSGTKTNASAVNGTPYGQYNITWQTEAGTVYGGTVDLVTGVLTVTHLKIRMDSLNIGVTGASGTKMRGYCYKSTFVPKQIGVANVDELMKCNALPTVSANDTYTLHNGVSLGGNNDYVYMYDENIQTAEGWQQFATDNNVEFTYPLATPTTYQLDPVQVACLLGQNNIWADCGAVEVEYVADTQLWVLKKLSE